MTDQPRTLRQYLDLGENLLASDLPPRERAILEQRLIDMKTLVEKIEAKQPSWPEMLQVIIPYIDTVCTLRTAVAVGAFQKANMRGIQARRAATAHKETDARATLRAAVKAHDQGGKPGTEAKAMLKDPAFREMYPYGVDALAKLIMKIRSS
jgi:hypothetical protein